jgi:hypothetical protein
MQRTHASPCHSHAQTRQRTPYAAAQTSRPRAYDKAVKVHWALQKKKDKNKRFFSGRNFFWKKSSSRTLLKKT